MPSSSGTSKAEQRQRGLPGRRPGGSCRLRGLLVGLFFLKHSDLFSGGSRPAHGEHMLMTGPGSQGFRVQGLGVGFDRVHNLGFNVWA